MPDGPLLFFARAPQRSFWRNCSSKRRKGAPPLGVWLAAGFWLGLASLSRNIAPSLSRSASSPSWRCRRDKDAEFAHPAPYAAGLAYLALAKPIIVWNADNHWILFAFQGGRGEPGAHWRPAQVASMVLGEIAWLTPWIFAPLASAWIATAVRPGRLDERRLFLLCLAAPSIVIFSLTPLWGSRGLPQWPMPGWFLSFPLLGAWISETWSASRLRAWAVGSTVALAIILLVLASHAATGWITRLFPLPAGAVDPTLEMVGWDALAGARRC